MLQVCLIYVLCGVHTRRSPRRSPRVNSALLTYFRRLCRWSGRGLCLKVHAGLYVGNAIHAAIQLDDVATAPWIVRIVDVRASLVHRDDLLATAVHHQHSLQTLGQHFQIRHVLSPTRGQVQHVT